MVGDRCRLSMYRHLLAVRTAVCNFNSRKSGDGNPKNPSPRLLPVHIMDEAEAFYVLFGWLEQLLESIRDI